LQRYNFFLKQQNFFAINLLFFCIFVVSYLLKMLRKLFIIAFLTAPIAAFAQNNALLNNLSFPDTIPVCRLDTIRFELIDNDNALVAATDTSLVFEWTSTFSSPDTTATTRYFVIPSYQHVYVEGTIWVRITDTVNDAVRYDTIVSQAFPLPEVRQRMQIDTVLCFGDTLLLQIEMDSVFHVRTIEWTSPIPLGTIDDSTALHVIFDSARIYTGTTHYEVIFRGYCTRSIWDVFQYVAHDTAFVFFARPPEIHPQTDTTMCYDGGLELTALDASGFEASQYEFRWIWNADTVGRENAFTVTYERQGQQIVKVWHEFCFRREIEGSLVVNDIYFVMDSVEIYFYNRAWTNAHILILDTVVCYRDHVLLNAIAEVSNLTTYHWRGLNVDTMDIHNPIRTVLPGSFTVMLRDSAGCEREFSVNVTVENCDPALEIPNVFTPNNDNVNDFFRPTQVNRVYNFHLRIYNRQGRMVYEFGPVADFPDEQEWQGWNGRIGGAESGTEAPTGTYFWAVRYNDTWGRIRREQGTVTLLR